MAQQRSAAVSPSWLVGLAIGWLVLFAAIFYGLALPNDASGLTRSDVWLALPDIIYFNVFSNPDGGNAGWRNLPQRLPLICVGFWILGGAWGIGRLLLQAIGITDAAKPNQAAETACAVDELSVSNRSRQCSNRITGLERFIFSLGMGLSALSLLMLGCGLAAQQAPAMMTRGVLGTIVSVPLIISCVMAVRSGAVSRVKASFRCDWIRDAFRGGQIPFSTLVRGCVLLSLILFVMAMVLGSLLPSIDFDVKEYHLGGPKEWFQTGSVHWLPHNVYTSFPFLTEMLLLLGMVLSGDWYWGASAGQFVLASFGVLTGLTVFAAAKRWFGERAAWAGLLIHLSTPWTYRISVIAYAEGGLTFYLMAAFLVVLMALETKSRALMTLAGLFAGSAMACKYPGLLSVVLPLGGMLVFILGRDRGAGIGGVDSERFELNIRSNGDKDDASHISEGRKHVLGRVAKVSVIYAAGVLIAIGPWLIKNLCETGNPVYPLLNSVFDGIDWNEDLEAHWKLAHSPPHHDPVDIAVKLFDVTFKSDWLSALLFGLAPFSFFAAKQLTGKFRERNEKSDSGDRADSSRRSIGVPSCRSRRFIIYITIGLVIFQFASWWLLTHRIDRFWVPLIPLVSLLSGVGVWWSEHRAWRLAAGCFVAAGVIFNLGFVTLPNCGFNAYLSDLNELPQKTETTAPGIAALNRLKLPIGSKVLLVGEAQIFDAQFPFVYNTVFDVSIFEQWCSANVPELAVKQQPFKPMGDIKQRLADEGITHVFVNWQECLRYRTTGYGGSDFVEPRRFRALCEAGVLRLQEVAFTGIRPIESFRDSERTEIDNWAPSLWVETNRGTGFVTGQLFEVQTAR